MQARDYWRRAYIWVCSGRSSSRAVATPAMRLRVAWYTALGEAKLYHRRNSRGQGTRRRQSLARNMRAYIRSSSMQSHASTLTYGRAYTRTSF